MANKDRLIFLSSLLLLLCVLLMLQPGVCLAAEEAEEDISLEGLGEIVSSEPEVIYQFPTIEPEGEIRAGYRYYDSKESHNAQPFEYPKDSLVLGGELRLFRFPHRLHLEVDEHNTKDYFGDLRYAYRDLMLFRWLARSLYHNYENLTLIDLDESTAAPGVNIRDAGDEYGAQVSLHTFSLRLKTPNFPLHAFMSARLVDKEGTVQQRSLLGAGTFNNMVRTSQDRDIDYSYREYEIGANSHLGPVEAQASHVEKDFDAGADSVLTDFYEASLNRPAGFYDHNLTPEFEGSSDTLQLHSSYTGGLVAAATISRSESDNLYSNASDEYVNGAVGLTWIPRTDLTFAMRANRVEKDADTPDTASIAGLTQQYDVRKSISYDKDRIYLTGRYRPMKRLSLKAIYSYDHAKRSGADEWGIEDSTEKHTAGISADARILQSLNASMAYAHETTDDPAYNTDPEDADKASASVTWTPWYRLNVFASYDLTYGERDSLTYTDTQDARDRTSISESATGSCSVMVLENLSFTAGYAYVRYFIRQDIVYDSLGGVKLTDPDVELEDKVHVYSATISYLPREALSLEAGVTHTVGEGDFVPDSEDLLEPESIAAFSEFEVRETEYSLRGEYRFPKDVSLALEYTYSELDDVIDNEYDDIVGGESHTFMITASKKWR